MQNQVIFILDDSEVVLTGLRISLQQAGITGVQFFSEPRPFMNHFSKEVSISIIDHNLGKKISGFDIVNFIREENPECRIILMSSTKNVDVIANYTGKVEHIVLKKEDWVQQIILILKKSPKTKYKWVSTALNALVSLASFFLPIINKKKND